MVLWKAPAAGRAPHFPTLSLHAPTSKNSINAMTWFKNASSSSFSWGGWAHAWPWERGWKIEMMGWILVTGFPPSQIFSEPF